MLSKSIYVLNIDKNLLKDSERNKRSKFDFYNETNEEEMLEDQQTAESTSNELQDQIDKLINLSY